MTALRAENLTILYDGKPAVEGVDFTIDEGETLLLLGPNGAGKTTLLRTIACFHREYRGRLEVFGREPCGARELIGYVPQSSNLNERVPLTALEVVAMGGVYRRGFVHFKLPPEILDKAREVLSFVGLEQVADRLFRELSGGQKQRVLLARALMSDPRLLLLDEPLSALDPSARVEVANVLDKIKRERGITMVITTHDINPLLEVGDKVMLLNRKLIAFGRPEEVLQDRVIKSVYGPLARVIPVEGKLFCITGDTHIHRHGGGGR
ncbi:ABC type manganese/zinc transporter ATPase [Thermococcus cleftensis]|uniref:ABC type manganese/zinc transporter ATPase n=1 Tax=Thermococcus cleftensis (strain DSM 27260 / KACC 17922 / CL1) TaxID=163003 RepID=I3ZWM3_THECF|nr:metal ABC transporter ATP-binding protein [Thermococcus cleftensis]AFL96107.1 ABC type manganese/zinc transporter ATPase [Thermococcus cleftensis]